MISARWLFVAAMFCTAAPLKADWREQIGFTRLQEIAAAELPNNPSQGFSQIEAITPDLSAYAPNTAASNFSGKTFSFKSGTSVESPHATSVANFFYGNGTSLLGGNIAVDLYSANSWLGSGFLKTGLFSAPSIENRAVQNHSWISTSYSQTAEANRRLDFAINRDGFVCVVGVNNGNSTVLPDLLAQSYHTLSVGLTNGSHSAGVTTLDGNDRIKPELVAPADATSFSTPMVSSAAALLFAKLTADHVLAKADRPRVIKALLLASTRKDTVASWQNTSTRPLDLRFGAGELNIHHAYKILRAGRATASQSLSQKNCGWAAESVSANSNKAYFFTIPAGSIPSPFAAALTWHRAVTSGLFGSNWTATLANLNLRLHQADGFTLGAAIAESNSLVDNVEHIFQAQLAPGDYAIIVQNLSNSATAFGLAWHGLPDVRISASSPIARESDLQQGEFTLTRSGDTVLPLFVPLVQSGTAIPGTDFLTIPNSVIIPAGASSIQIRVTPIADSLVQGGRSLVLGIAQDFTFVRNPSETATVTIEDKPFDAWRFLVFSSAQLADPLVSEPLADPDADGLPNLLEYALAIDPLVPGSSALTFAQSDGFITLQAFKNPAATDLLWVAEVSDDLENWAPAVTLLDSPQEFLGRDSELSETYPARFIRLRITRP